MGIQCTAGKGPDRFSLGALVLRSSAVARPACGSGDGDYLLTNRFTTGAIPTGRTDFGPDGCSGRPFGSVSTPPPRGQAIGPSAADLRRISKAIFRMGRRCWATAKNGAALTQRNDTCSNCSEKDPHARPRGRKAAAFHFRVPRRRIGR